MQTVFRPKYMQPAQVNFPIDIYLRMKRLAKSQNKAFAKWLRDLAEKELKKKEPKKMRFCDMPTFSWPGVETNISERIDEIAYGDPHHEKK